MLETPHVIVGAAIALKTANPLIALPLSFASHFILDMVPHWNPHINYEKKHFGHIQKSSKLVIYLDAILSLLSGLLLALRVQPDNYFSLIVLISGFTAILPDLIEGPYYFFSYRNKWLDKWIRFQKSIQCDTGIIYGIITQLIIIIAALWWIKS